MQGDRVPKGLLIKLVTDYYNVPDGTWATVELDGNYERWGLVYHPVSPTIGQLPPDFPQVPLNIV